jgi:hypothetical protein
MNRKQRRRLKKLFGKNGGKKGRNPYFVSQSGWSGNFIHKGGDCHAEKKG